MIKKTIGIFLLLATSACQSPPPSNTASSNNKPQDFYQIVSATSSKWTYACYKGGSDAFGENKKSPYCIVSVDNLGKTLIGNSYTIKLSDIVRYSGGKPKIIRPTADSTCENSPRRIAVDGKRIDSMSDETQIDRMKAGTLYTREEQASWPYCGVAPHAAYLSGFSEVYDAMAADFRSGKFR